MLLSSQLAGALQPARAESLGSSAKAHFPQGSHSHLFLPADVFFVHGAQRLTYMYLASSAPLIPKRINCSTNNAYNEARTSGRHAAHHGTLPLGI